MASRKPVIRKDTPQQEEGKPLSMKPRTPRTMRNARISSTFLGYEDHGILTYNLNLDYGGISQGFGTYALDNPSPSKSPSNKRTPSLACGQHVACVLRTVGVPSWESLVGKHVRVVSEGNRIVCVGHLLNNVWFYPSPSPVIADAPTHDPLVDPAGAP